MFPRVYPELATIFGARLPDLRGLFLRGHGAQAHSQLNGSLIGVTSTLHQSASLGQIQGDAIRNIEGDSGGLQYNGSQQFNGPFVRMSAGAAFPSGGGNNSAGYTNFSASRVVPTAAENRPVNMAVRYLVRAAK